MGRALRSATCWPVCDRASLIYDAVARRWSPLAASAAPFTSIVLVASFRAGRPSLLRAGLRPVRERAEWGRSLSRSVPARRRCRWPPTHDILDHGATVARLRQRCATTSGAAPCPLGPPPTWCVMFACTGPAPRQEEARGERSWCALPVGFDGVPRRRTVDGGQPRSPFRFGKPARQRLHERPERECLSATALLERFIIEVVDTLEYSGIVY